MAVRLRAGRRWPPLGASLQRYPDVSGGISCQSAARMRPAACPMTSIQSLASARRRGGGQARPGRAPLSSHRTGPRHMGGGNLSLQVHPATGCAQDRLGMAYTQDESYYILDASSDSRVYLRLHEGVTREGFVGALRRVQAGDRAFDAERWSNRIPVSRHDHVSIPAGTVHCSGSDTLGIETGVPIYEQYARDRSRFDFVARPPARLRRLVRLGTEPGGAPSSRASPLRPSRRGRGPASAPFPLGPPAPSARARSR